MSSLIVDYQIDRQAIAPGLLAKLPDGSMIQSILESTIHEAGYTLVSQGMVPQGIASQGIASQTEICVRLVGEVEMQALNSQFRQKDTPTNVLSFPFELPVGLTFEDYPHLGDMVICVSLAATESHQQHKSFQAHFTHLLVHGCLHLLGYDHLEDQEAEVMEQLERKILSALGYPDPYIYSEMPI